MVVKGGNTSDRYSGALVRCSFAPVISAKCKPPTNAEVETKVRREVARQRLTRKDEARRRSKDFERSD